jgi:hypothetical protein
MWFTGDRPRPSDLVWSGEDNLCGGRGDPLPKWRSSLVEATSRLPRELGKCLSGESSGALGRDLVTGKQYSYVSTSTTWTRGGLVPTDTTIHEINRVSRVCFLSSLFTFPHYFLESLLAFTFLE